MGTKQHIRTLNREIQKLNGVIDYKISQGHNYKREARQHKKLLDEIRSEELRRTFFPLLSLIRRF